MSIKGISLEDLDNLQVDEKRNLYWEGKKLKTELKLSFWQNVGAIAVAASAITASLASILASVVTLQTGETTHEISVTIEQPQEVPETPAAALN